MALFAIPEDRPSGAQIARRAWSSGFCAIKQMPALVISALIVLTALTLDIACLRFLANAGASVNQHARLPIAMFGFGWLQSALTTLATSMVAAPIAVGIHRFILLGEVSRGPISIASRRTLKFFLWAAGMQLIINSVNQIATGLVVSHYLPFHNLAGFGFIMIAAEVPLVVVTWIFLIYLALIFPALAIDEPVVGAHARISMSMTQMRGHFWQFVGAILLTCAPITLIGTVITTVLLYRITRPIILYGVSGGSRAIWLYQLQNGWFYVDYFLGALMTVLTVALAASVASWLYASISTRLKVS
jgi:hypothetical protein